MNTPPVQIETGSDIVRQALDETTLNYYKVSDLARAMKCDKETVRNTAAREQWHMRWNGNRQEFAPPPHIAQIMIAAPQAERQAQGITVKFDDLIHDEAQRDTVMRREAAVMLLRENLHLGKEIALETVAATMRASYPGFKCSARSLRYWDDRFTLYGRDGLVDQKRGVVGRKSYAAQLDERDVLRYKAQAIEHGNARKGDGDPQLNIARAYRNMVADPTIRGPVRDWLHAEHSSKSYVPPSVRRALESSLLTTALIQRGPKAAKLYGPWTECDYDNGNARGAFTCDDMTANAYVWVEWPNEQGFLLIRPQILAAMHVGSMSWLSIRVVIRPKGQYTSDDAWGLIGDVFDNFGVFSIAILEGGIWQNKKIIGELFNDKDRIFGLEAMGCRVIHTRSPRGKIIETAFNTFQHAADNVKGFCGRHEQVDCPETVKAQLAEVRAGKAHPRQYFMHASEYKAHISGVMNSLNHERNDGKICKGLAPADKWAQETPDNKQMPDSSKWLLRACKNTVSVTSNGVRVTQHSGKYEVRFFYSHPALVPHQGERVVVFWNDFDTDTDAVIYSIRNKQPHQLICVAPRVQRPDRLGASGEAMHAESTRKSAIMNFARDERANMAEFLQRSYKTAPAQAKDAEIDEKLRAVRAEQGKRIKSNEILKRFQGTPEALLENPTLDPKADKSDEQNDQAAETGQSAGDRQSRTRQLPGGEGSVSRVHSNITQSGDGSVEYTLQPSGSEKAQYVDYLLDRLTEFRKAGSSFGQAIGNVSLAVTIRIAKSHLKCDLHAESHFDDVCQYLKSKIDATILGKRNAAKGTPNYHAFDAIPDLNADSLIN